MRWWRVTIRAKLYVAILLTVIGPVITIAVALHGMSRLGDRFDEVQDRAERRALALNLKYGVTDVNGWQTAYGYDDGTQRAFDDSREDSRRGLIAVALGALLVILLLLVTAADIARVALDRDRVRE